METQDAAAFVGEIVEEVFRLGRSFERVRATLTPVVAAAAAIKDAVDLDPDLSPELGAAVGHLSDVEAALGRAADFVIARHEAWMQNVRDRVG